MEVTSRCKVCKKDFTYTIQYNGMIRTTCSERCDLIAGKVSQRLATIEETITRSWKFLNAIRIRLPHKATSYETYPAGRHCAWTGSSDIYENSHKDSDQDPFESNPCITTLCSYNPGPYCFLHSKILKQAFIDKMHNELEQERLDRIEEFEEGISQGSMKAERTHRQGQSYSEEFCKAVETLEEEKFKTELYVTKSGATLRWFRAGSKWHVTVKTQPNLANMLDTLGNNALKWLLEREKGTSGESKYAVREV